MSYLRTSNTEVYTEALKITEDLSPPAEGFVKPKEETVIKSVARIQKQNNTTITILVRICEELESQKESIRRLEAAIKAKTPQASEVLEGSIQDLQKKLENLKLGEGTSGEKPVKAAGKFYVFEDPKVIFGKEKDKLKKR